MSRFPEKARLKEQAEEDQYFARRDRELIARLRARRRKASGTDGARGDAADSGPPKHPPDS